MNQYFYHALKDLKNKVLRYVYDSKSVVVERSSNGQSSVAVAILWHYVNA